MKARAVKGLDPGASLADGAEQIIRVRLDELFGFVPAALDPDEAKALHDMRIAAKRLRYLLELTGFCFGPYARRAAKHAKSLQELIGEIHDCDEMLPRVLEHLEGLRTSDAAAVRAAAGPAEDLEPSLLAAAPNRAAYRGVESYAIYLQARRALLHERFATLWGNLQRGAFRKRLEEAVAERAAPTPAGVQDAARPPLASGRTR